MTRVSISITLILLNLQLVGQTLIPGTGMVDFLRRQQLTSMADSTSSFMSLPVTPLQSQVHIFDSGFTKSVYSLAGFDLNLLYNTLDVEWNSRFPYFSNNGSMVPSRGIQNVISGGFSMSSEWLSIQLRPEIRFSQNLSYDGFPDSHDNDNWQVRYRWWNWSDSPERFGTGEIFDILPGQSHALLHYKNVGIGISTENLWWGPGRKNSLLMSNNARGFSHLTFRSLVPVNIAIGHLEWQLIGGRLEGSGFRAPRPSDPVRPPFNSFDTFEDDWRYLNAFTFTYQPKWIQGFYVGMSRAVQQYSGNVSENGGYLPVFINIFRENDEGRDESEIDQLLSLHFRWIWYDARAEVYFEYGRNDASLNLRDFLMSPRHSRAFIFGISKIFDVNIENWDLQMSYEHTHMEQSNNFVIRDAGSWYVHSNVRHGYTHRGEVLGAGIGPGSNYDYFEFALVDGIRKIGLEFERLAHNQDFFYAAFQDTRDWRRFWIDYTFGLSGSWKLRRWLLSGSFKFTRAMNYQWELFDNPNNQPYFTNGTDISNWQTTISTIYLLK